jgi:hypothetical protein
MFSIEYIEAGDAFSEAKINALSFTSLTLFTDSLNEIIKVIGEYKSVQENLSCLVINNPLIPIKTDELESCLRANGLGEVLVQTFLCFYFKITFKPSNICTSK